jgi:hypothetical protein
LAWNFSAQPAQQKSGAAEVIILTGVLADMFGGGGIDGHPTDGIAFADGSEVRGCHFWAIISGLSFSGYHVRAIISRLPWQGRSRQAE